MTAAEISENLLAEGAGSRNYYRDAVSHGIYSVLIFMETTGYSILGLVSLLGILPVTPAFGVINIDLVAIGNIGNGADPATGSVYGAVSYAYSIAQNETSISQYCAFLNAMATTDTYGLYNANMAANSAIAGITQSGVSGSFSYSVVAGSGNKPITYVSWFDAARFCNWLHHGQPTGLQTTGTTEDGAYALLGAVSGTGFSVQPGAKVWIPSENEWYKAAYYDPTKDGTGGYWMVANQSNSLTSNTIGVPGAANFFDGDYVGSGSAVVPVVDALTNGGAYGANSDSYYGTNDQTGNVWEWNDAVINSDRGLRGGAWDLPATPTNYAAASFRGGDVPTLEFVSVGFRIATVPEPSSFMLTMLAGGGLLMRRKR